jgi:succinoglycan biosynthesis transport protein ExoP
MLPTPDPGPKPGPDYLPAILPPHRATVLAPVAVPAALATNPDPIALLKALRRRWPLALAAGLLCAVVTTALAYLVIPPAKYTARALLHVSSVRPRIMLPDHELVPEYGAYQRTQLTFVKSRLVLNAALKREDVAKLPVITRQVDPIEWLEKELQVDFANGSEILRISMSGQEAAVPMALVNAVTQAYLDEVVDDEGKRRRDRYDLLKQTWRNYQESLREKRKELRRLTEQAGSDDKKTVANIQQLELERLGRVESELARVQSELRNLRVEARVLEEERALNTSEVTPAMIEQEIARDHSIEVLHARVERAERGISQNARLVRSPNDPILVKYRQELAAAKADLAAQYKKLGPIIAAQLREKMHSDLGARGALLQERIKILSGIEAVMKDDVKRLSERSRSMSQTTVDLFSIQDEIGSADEIAKKVGAEIETLNLELQAPPRIRLVEKAALPRTKDELRPLKMSGMAGLGAFALVLAGVSFWEFRSRRIDSADQVVYGLGMNLVGTLPVLPGRNRMARLKDAENQRWQNLLIESVDAARTALLHVARTESIRVVMVASALGGEGKTSLSSHLATSLARAGRRTLLIDGDLRRPSAHRLFDLPVGPGFSEVLRDEAQFDDVIRPTLASGVWLVPAGESDSRSIQALASQDLRGLFDQLKDRFDFIVIDSSPVLPVADALLIGQHADAVLFSIMRNVSRFPKVHAAYQRMSSLGIRMLGAIVTGAQTELYGSEYQYVIRARNTA